MQCVLTWVRYIIMIMVYLLIASNTESTDGASKYCSTLADWFYSRPSTIQSRKQIVSLAVSLM